MAIGYGIEPVSDRGPRRPMGNCDDGILPPACATFWTIPASVVGIECTRHLVKDEHLGFVTRARARDSLCRWPPESLVPISPTSVSSPCRQLLDEAAGTRLAKGCVDGGIRYCGFAECQVGAHRVVKQRELLRHIADL